MRLVREVRIVLCIATTLCFVQEMFTVFPEASRSHFKLAEGGVDAKDIHYDE